MQFDCRVVGKVGVYIFNPLEGLYIFEFATARCFAIVQPVHACDLVVLYPSYQKFSAKISLQIISDKMLMSDKKY
jgi:hypothetical protein